MSLQEVHSKRRKDGDEEGGREGREGREKGERRERGERRRERGERGERRERGGEEGRFFVCCFMTVSARLCWEGACGWYLHSFCCLLCVNLVHSLVGSSNSMFHGVKEMVNTFLALVCRFCGAARGHPGPSVLLHHAATEGAHCSHETDYQH